MGVIFDTNALPPDQTSSRCLLVFFGATMLSLLIVARCLEPADEGFGTHRSLGLPACNFRLMFDLPCPSCGMTTSWSLLTRGRITDSIEANTGGFLLGLAALVFGGWMLASGIRGKWLLGFPKTLVFVTVLVGILFATVANWVWQLI